MRKVVYPTFYCMFFMFLTVPLVGHVLLVRLIANGLCIRSVPWWYRTSMGTLVDIYILFPFCTLYLCITFILSLLTMPKHGDMLFSEGGVCDNYVFWVNS